MTGKTASLKSVFTHASFFQSLEILVRQLNCTDTDIIRSIIDMLYKSYVWKHRALAADLLIVLGMWCLRPQSQMSRCPYNVGTIPKRCPDISNSALKASNDPYDAQKSGAKTSTMSAGYRPIRIHTSYGHLTHLWCVCDWGVTFHSTLRGLVGCESPC